MFAGEGTPERTNRRFHYLSAGPAGGAAVDGVRLGDAVRRGPARAPRHLRQGRQLGRVDRHARRRQEALLGLRPLRADDLGVDDDQRAGADHPRLLHERGDRPAGRAPPPADRPGRGRPGTARRVLRATVRVRHTRASCPRAHDGLGLGLLGVSGDMVVEPDVYERIKAETLRTVRGTVQADILKEDQAQNTCIFSTEFAMKMMGDVQEYFVDQQRAQLLQRLDQRLPHRRGGGQPDHPARVHARERLHDRRVLPRARAWRSTTSRRT